MRAADSSESAVSFYNQAPTYSPILAEAERFELSIPCGIPVFETGALDQLCDASLLGDSSIRD